MQIENNMVIHFMDGSSVSYNFPKQLEDHAAISSRVNKLLEQQYLIIESDGSLQFYPVCNIKSIQTYPVPDILPEIVIRGATLA